VLKWPPRSHKNSGLGDLYMDGKQEDKLSNRAGTRSKFMRSRWKKYSKSWCPESVSVLRHCLWPFGPCILSWPTRVATMGS
jgi:hypothetical protein